MPIRYSNVAGGSVPGGTSLDRPIAPEIGDQFVNGTLGIIEIYTPTGWVSAGGANDFNVSVTGLNTIANFDREYLQGGYSITSVTSDVSLDVYAFSSNGSLVGYTNTKSLSVSAGFNKIVILGGITNDLLSFNYKKTFITTPENSELGAGPYITSVTPTAAASINDVVTITGGNFATDVEILFRGTDGVSAAAKSIVRSSATQVLVTRPDNMSPGYSPYDIIAVNPMVPSPAGSEVNILSNSITAGTNPVWTTTTPQYFTVGSAYSLTLVATDTENTDIDYTISSGTLPAGLSLNSETGQISGTVTGVAENVTTTVVFRATDTGGNFLDKSISFISDAIPVWTTTSLANALINNAYSAQLVASGGTVGPTLTYTVNVGSLPAGLTLSSSGLISGTATSGSQTFTIRAMDEYGAYADQQLTITVEIVPAQGADFSSFSSSTGGAVPASAYCSVGFRGKVYSNEDSATNWTVASSPSATTYSNFGAGQGLFGGTRHVLIWGRSIIYIPQNAPASSVLTSTVNVIHLNDDGTFKAHVVGATLPAQASGMFTTNSKEYFMVIRNSGGYSFIKPTDAEVTTGWYTGGGTAKSGTFNLSFYSSSYNANSGWFDVTTGKLFANRWNTGNAQITWTIYQGTISNLLKWANIPTNPSGFTGGGEVGNSNTTIAAGADPYTGTVMAANHSSTLLYTTSRLGLLAYSY